MKKQILTIVMSSLLLVSFTSTICAQTYNDDDSLVEEINVSSDDAEIPILFQALGIDNSVNPRSATLTGSQVFLRQVGDLNRATIDVTADVSDINLFQNGDANSATLTYEARSVITDIEQNGNDNLVNDFSINNPLEDVSLDLQQNGNYLTFERIGTNSLTRSMRFVQTEASPTLIIRSFN